MGNGCPEWENTHKSNGVYSYACMCDVNEARLHQSYHDHVLVECLTCTTETYADFLLENFFQLLFAKETNFCIAEL